MSNVEPGSFSPFEVSATHIIYVGLGVFVALFGMFSLFIKEKLYLGEAPIAAIFGIIVGPVALNLFSPNHWGGLETATPGGHITNEITLEVMRVTIALSVFAVGVELPKKYLLRHWRSIALLLGPVMVWGWLVTAAFMYALVPGLDFLNCLVVASCVTPTDPILAQAVVGGPWAEKHVPAHLRHMLMCESGCNDGAAFPFLYLALFLTTNRDNHGKAIAEWFYDAWAYQIIFGTILGALIGWAARKLMRFSERHKLVDRESFVAQYVSLAVASMGVNVLLGSDDLLAAFACGTAFAWDGWFTKQTEDSNFSSIVDLLFNVATFIYIGALMPFHDFVGGNEGERNTLSLWRLFVLAICVLLTKRLPIVIALWRWIPDIKTFREAVFAGHFGPIGVGAIFIATLARTLLPEEVPSPPETTNDYLALTVQPIIFFFVLCSIIIHGLTIPFFAFSRRATTITRTWSRNPSLAPSEEPGWLSRIRRTRTGEKGDGLEPEEGNMTEIERVLNAQLGIIGRGAIGGDAEKELRREGTSGEEDSETAQADDSSGSGGGGGFPRPLTNPKTTRRLNAVDGMDDDDDADNSDYEEDHRDVLEDPTSEWGGADTVEMRRYREKQAERRAQQYAQVRARQQGEDEKQTRSSDQKQGDAEEADLGLGRHRHRDDNDDDNEESCPMDRHLHHGNVKKDAGVRDEEAEEREQDRRDREGRMKYGCGTEEEDEEKHEQEQRRKKNKEDDEDDRQTKEHDAILQDRQRDSKYPMTRSWVEGHKLVIEHQKHKSSDPECHVIPLVEDDRAAVVGAESPAHAWVQHHSKAIEHHLGLSDVYDWHPAEAANHLVYHRIPTLYNEHLTRKQKKASTAKATSQNDESKSERDARADMLYGAMEWASQRRRNSDANNSGKNNTSDRGRDDGNSRPVSMLRDGSTVSGQSKGASSSSSTSTQHIALPDSAADGRRRKVGGAKKAPASISLVQPSDTESEEGEIHGWLSPSKPGVTRKPPKKSRSTSKSSSPSPSRRASLSPGLGTEKESKPKVHICRPSVNDVRRMSMRKKILAGQLSLKGRPDHITPLFDSEYVQHQDDASSVYDAEPSSSSSSAGEKKFFPRSASAGGLGESNSSPSSSTSFMQPQQKRQSMQKDRSGGSLAIPRTRTLGIDGRDHDDREGRRDHSRTSSVQWLDIPEGSHEHQQRTSRSHHSHHLSIPSFFGGSSNSRPTSRSGSPTRSPTTTHANLSPAEEQGAALDPATGTSSMSGSSAARRSKSNASLKPPTPASNSAQSGKPDNGLSFQRFSSVGGLSSGGDDDEESGNGGGRKRGRIAALLSNLTSSSSSSSGGRSGQQQQQQGRDEESQVEEGASEPTPSLGLFGGGSGNGGILNSSNPPSRTGTSHGDAIFRGAGANKIGGDAAEGDESREVLDDNDAAPTPVFGNTVTFA